MIGNIYGIKIKKSGQLHSDHFHSSIVISYSKVKRLFSGYHLQRYAFFFNCQIILLTFSKKSCERTKSFKKTAQNCKQL